MTQGTIDYPELMEGAMRAVVRAVLRKTSLSGLPGEHHFYITFRTEFPGVKISEVIRARYPQEMTIVLQHQFWDFRVEDQQFSVTLSFGGVPERLVIPFAALVSFTDPSVKFSLQFHPAGTEDVAALPARPAYDDAPPMEAENDAEGSGAEIISLDSFRKK